MQNIRIIAAMEDQIFYRNADAAPKTRDLNARALGAFFKPGSVDTDARTVEVVFASDTPYLRRDYWNDRNYNEVLSMNPDHVRLGRMRNGAPLCDNHDRFGKTLDCVLGVVESVRLEGSQMIGVIRFSKREEAEKVWQEVIDGILRNFSVGYRIYAMQTTEATEAAPIEQRTAIDWEPFELSITPVPADYTAQVRTHKDNLSNPQNNPTVMEEDIVTPGTPPTTEATRAADAPAATETRAAAPAPAPAPPAAPVAPVTETRAAGAPPVRVAADAVNVMDQVRTAGLDISVASDLVRRGLTQSEVTAEITRQWEAKAAPTTTGRTPAASVSGDDEQVRSSEAMQNAILHRAGAPGIDLTEHGREYRNMSVLRMAESFLQSRGISTRSMAPFQVAQRALQMRSAAGAMTTTDFAGILGNTINRNLRARYQAQERTFTRWAKRATHSDLRLHSKYQLSGLVGSFDKIEEGGEYKAKKLVEGVEAYKIDKYGGKIGYTLEMMLADDMSAFTALSQVFASEAAELQSSLVYGQLFANDNMGDGNALFSVAHNNIATGANVGAINEANVSAARAAMRKQKGLNGKFITVRPKYLVVGPDRETEAQKFLQVITARETANVNIFGGAFELIVEPRVGNGWYLMADPATIDTQEFAFLDGEQELYTETQEAFQTDATEVKARLFFGTKPIDWRGMYFNPGA